MAGDSLFQTAFLQFPKGAGPPSAYIQTTHDASLLPFNLKTAIILHAPQVGLKTTETF